MKCKKCGKEVNSESIFCQYCGEKLNKGQAGELKFTINTNDDMFSEDIITKSLEQPTDIDRKNEPNNKRSGIIFKVIAVVIVILGIIAFKFVANLNSPIETFKEYLDAGDYKAALQLYKENKNKKEFVLSVGDYALSEAENIIKGYRENSTEAKDAKQELNRLDEFINVTEYIKEIEKVEESKQNYIIGMQYAENKEYNLAIINLKKVNEEDLNFENSQAKIDELKSIFKSEVIAKSNEQLQLKNYEEALKPLYTYNAVIPDEEINGLIEKIKTDMTEVAAAEKEDFISTIKSKISIVYDDVDNDYTIVPRGYSARYVNIGWNIHAEPRIIVKNDNSKSANLAYCFGFSNDDWVFFEKIKFSAGQDKYELNIDYFNRGTQIIGGGDIAEWVLFIHDEYLGGIMEKVVNFEALVDIIENNMDNKITIRFSGDGYLDFVLSKAEKQNLVDFYKLKDLLDEDSTFFDELNS